MRIMLPSLRLPRDGPRLCFRAKGKSEGMACVAAGDGKAGRGVYEMLADRLWATGTSLWMDGAVTRRGWRRDWRLLGDWRLELWGG